MFPNLILLLQLVLSFRFPTAAGYVLCSIEDISLHPPSNGKRCISVTAYPHITELYFVFGMLLFCRLGLEVVDTGLLAILCAWQVTEVDLWLMIPAIGVKSGI